MSTTIDQGPFGQVGAEVAGALQEEFDGAVVAAYQVVHEVPPEAQLGLQAYALLAQLRLEDEPGPVQEHHVLRFQVGSVEVDPEVPRRRAGADGGPEHLALLDPPALDGHGEVAVGEPGVAVAALPAGLVDALAPGGPQALLFERRVETVLFGSVSGAGDQAPHRILYDDGAPEHTGDLACQLFDLGLAAGALQKGPARAVGEQQQPVILGEDLEEPS